MGLSSDETLLENGKRRRIVHIHDLAILFNDNNDQDPSTREQE